MYARFSNQGKFNLLLERCSHYKKFREKNRIERPLLFGDSASGHDTWVNEPGHFFGVLLIKVCREKKFSQRNILLSRGVLTAEVFLTRVFGMSSYAMTYLVFLLQTILKFSLVIGKAARGRFVLVCMSRHPKISFK